MPTSARVPPARAVPQLVQKAASEGMGRPHWPHGGASSAPQPPQNRSFSAGVRPQRVQAAGMATLLATSVPVKGFAAYARPGTVRNCPVG
ncbi:hypothetical protein Asi02nite_13610 [Asanoa siamensis]|uniref:Uncharacterized protein n=1 Tax=Asanoa siamensis TaxID=926357 RepID=A0ABQ4CLH9_9ACTN|nr:hypothetical protein Asi02nite_13610 [Asanoa siamensis]